MTHRQAIEFLCSFLPIYKKVNSNIRPHNIGHALPCCIHEILCQYFILDPNYNILFRFAIINKLLDLQS